MFGGLIINIYFDKKIKMLKNPTKTDTQTKTLKSNCFVRSYEILISGSQTLTALATLPESLCLMPIQIILICVQLYVRSLCNIITSFYARRRVQNATVLRKKKVISHDFVSSSKATRYRDSRRPVRRSVRPVVYLARAASVHVR